MISEEAVRDFYDAVMKKMARSRRLQSDLKVETLCQISPYVFISFRVYIRLFLKSLSVETKGTVIERCLELLRLDSIARMSRKK
jgi:hypothetical protein